jgi:hypothetical protein
VPTSGFITGHLTIPRVDELFCHPKISTDVSERNKRDTAAQQPGFDFHSISFALARIDLGGHCGGIADFTAHNVLPEEYPISK